MPVCVSSLAFVSWGRLLRLLSAARPWPRFLLGRSSERLGVDHRAGWKQFRSAFDLGQFTADTFRHPHVVTGLPGGQVDAGCRVAAVPPPDEGRIEAPNEISTT